MAPLDSGIEIRGVSRTYGTFVAVQDLSFHVAPGEIVCLLGPNGAGKTTTLRMVATLIPPDTGTIRVAGIDVSRDPLGARSALGYQTGDTGLYARLTPREFLTYFGTLHSVPRHTLADRIARLIADFGISEFADRLCGNLSTGQRQRVSLARTLVNDPPVIVLDEPSAGLDILSAQFILEALRRVADAGRAVLFSSHIMSEVELIADRVVVMHRGTLRAEGTVADVTAHFGESNLSRAFLRAVRDEVAP